MTDAEREEACCESHELILYRLGQVERSQTEGRQDVGALRKEVNTAFLSIEKQLVRLDVRSGVWGAIGGAVAVAVPVLFVLLK